MGRVAAPHIITDDSALGGSVIERSLRFNDDDGDFLSRDFGSGGNRKKWTFSAWIKRNKLGAEQRIFGGDTNASHIFFASNDELTWDVAAPGSSASANLNTTQVFRDPLAWFHLVCAFDTDNSTADNRMRMYINGTEVTSFGTRTNPSSGYALNAINADGDRATHTIGRRTSAQGSDGMRFDGYMAEINFIDGQQYDPSFFGYIDSQTGLWRPKRYEGTYGTNGFHLEFKNNSSTSALGKDTSGNGHDFTAYNFSAGEELLTNGEFNSDSNWTKDSSWTISGGKASNGGGGQIYQTISVVSGRIYKMKAIMDFTSVSSIANTSIGFRDTGNSSFYAYQATFSNGSKTDFTPNTINEMSVTWTSSVTGNVRARCYSSDSGLSIDNWSVKEVTDCMLDTPSDRYATLNSVNGYSYNTTFANGNLFANIPASNTYGRAFGNIPIKSGKWYWEVYYNQAGGNGNYLYVGLQDPESGFYRAVRGSDGEQYPNTGGTAVRFATGDIINVAVDLDAGKWYIGRNGTYWYSGNPVAGTGFVHSDLISANASTPIDGLVPLFYNATSGATQQFSVNFGQQPLSYTPPTGYKTINSKNLPIHSPSVLKPQKHFNTVIYTGTGSSRIIESGFNPGLVWCKSRSVNGGQHFLSDSVRGVGKLMQAETNGAEYDAAGNGINANGAIWGGGVGVNGNGSTYVNWFWKAGGAAVSNSDGTITTSISANQEAGFSIISYTGNSTSGGTIGHGLGRTPKWFIVKSRSQNRGWNTYHVSIGNTKYIQLQQTHAAQTQSGWWNNTSPTSSVITLGNDGDVNNSSQNYICYAWSEIPGYSKFGSYTGNGSTNGFYVHLGFRPAWVMVKRYDGGGQGWNIFDNKRNTFNLVNKFLIANSANAEATGSALNLDFLSNGFKFRGTDGGSNASGSNYIYMAFAEQPGITPYDTQTNAR